MHARIIKIGNSQGVRIPKALLEETGLSGDVDMTVREGALVISERDGAPLPADEGPLALVSLRDTQPGPRHVKWLAKIEIRRVGD